MSGEKQSDSKFLTMLESRGIVRKKLEEDESPIEAISSSDTLQHGEDLNSNQHLSNSTPVESEPQITPFSEPTTDDQATATPSEMQTSEHSFGSASEEVEPYAQNDAYDISSAYQQATGEASSRDTAFSWVNSEDTFVTTPPEDNTTERYLDIEELYEVLDLKSNKTDSIYLIEDYLKSIPDSLPDESRREIITKIVASSGFDYDLLMGDGILRVKMLKEYAEKFARYTDDYVEARMAEASKLEDELARIHALIEERRNLHKKQFLSIEAEAGRLREILTFING